MRTFTLQRRTPLKFSEKGVQGKLYDDNGNTLGIFTLELPWKDNQQGISCIPAGKYRVTRRTKKTHWWAKYPTAFEFHDVPGRYNILIHAANWISQLKGCIAVGTAASNLPWLGKLAVWNSRAGMKKLHTILPDECYIEIINA